MDKKKAPKHSSYLVFGFSVFTALFLEIVSFPAEIEMFRPDFLALVLIYFAFFDPQRINIGLAWICGLFLDLLTGAPLAINALICASQVFIIHTQFRRFSNYVIYQQAIIIGLVNIIAHVVAYWLEHLLGAGNYHVNFIGTAIATTIAWMFIALLLKFLCKKFAVVPFGAEQED